MNNEKIRIGRIERVDFPEWGLEGVRGKIDTGAFTSSLHCQVSGIDESEGSVTFLVPASSGDEGVDVTICTDIVALRKIKSSNGVVELRVVVRGKVRIGGELYPIELSLTDRSDMRFPLLLGRRFIRNRFIVDVSQTYLLDKE